MIEVGALRALRSVAALGTLARAADELGFTASAVSQQIKRLERQLGMPVLASAGRGVVLTPAGQAVVDSSLEVFQALERCAEAAQSVAEGAPRGVLRVAAFSTGIRGLLAPVHPRLLTRYPDLRLHITEQDPDQALHSVEAGPTSRSCMTPTVCRSHSPPRCRGAWCTPTSATSSWPRPIPWRGPSRRWTARIWPGTRG